MKSRIFSSSMVKENLKQRIWIPALVTVGLIVLYPIYLMIQFDLWCDQKLTYEMIQRGYERFLAVSGMNMHTGIVAVVAGLICAVAGFEYLHSKKKLDCYHSLPVKRGQIYWQHVWAGLLSFIVPLILAVFLAICVGASHGYFSFHFVKLGLLNIVGYSVLFLLVYGVSLLAMMLTGRVLVGILGSCVLLVYMPALMQMFKGYESVFFKTCAAEYAKAGGIFKVLENYGSPLSWWVNVADRNRNGESVLVLLIGGLTVGILLLILNYWIYHRRPTEAAGHSMAFSMAARVIQYFIEIPLVLIMGLIGHEMVIKHQNIWWVISMVVGLVIIHGVIEVIYYADFRKFFRHLGHLGISAVVVAVICVIYKADLIGYDRYLPAQDKLESLDVSSESLTGSYHVHLTKQGDLVTFENHTDSESDYLKLDAGDRMYDLIENTINNLDEKTSENEEIQIQVRYCLKNGKKVYRSYSVMQEALKEAAQTIPKTGQLKEALYPQLEEKSKYVTDIGYENGVYYTVYSQGEIAMKTGQEKNKLLSLLAQDVQEADSSVFEEEPIGVLNVSYSNIISTMFSSDGYGNEALLIYPGFSRTCEYLKELGIEPKDELKLSQIEQISIYQWDEENQEEMETYTNQEDIKKLLPRLKLANTWTAWLDVRDLSRNVEIVLKDKAGSEQNIRYGYYLVPEE